MRLGAPIAAARAALLALAVAFSFTPLAARADDPVKTEERRASSLAAAFAPVARAASASVVAVRLPSGEELGFGVALEDGRTILTSRSILERAGVGPVVVATSKGESAAATIAGRNEAYDVAVLTLAVKPASLLPIAVGASRGLAIGQWVVTVGTAAEKPLAVGVVSALARRVEARPEEAQAFEIFGLFNENGGPKRSYARVIQHDAPIDGDKHGAPLVDASGNLVGVNVANAYRGSSYAAPIDDVLPFLADLKAGRPGPAMPRPGFLGVAVGAIADAALAKARGIVGVGVEIKEIQPGQAAEKAGLRAGDVVLSVAGLPVRSLERFGLVVRDLAPGATVVVRVLRGGRDEVDVKVVVGARPEGSE